MQLVTAADLAAALGVHVHTVYNWAKQGRLPTVRLGPQSIRFRPEDVERFIAERRRDE